MNWGELDSGHPVIGDVRAVERVAAEFGRVGEEAEALTRRLRGVGDAAGARVWRGEAAEVFRRLLAETEPELVTLSTSHDAAEQAVRRYAVALGDALDDARRALAEGATATVDRNEAQQRRDAARDEAESAGSTAREAEGRIRTAQAHSLVAIDPGYQAELRQYEIRMRVQRDRARSREAAARGRQASGQADVDRAVGRLEAAKRLARQAAQIRDDAARTVSRELDDAGRAAIDQRNVLQKLWNAGEDLVREVTASPAFASFLNVLSDVGDILGSMARLAAIIPGLQGVAGGLLIFAVALKGAAILGTYVAYLNGHASGSQVLGRGLDLGMALVPALKVLKARNVTRAGEIKRAIWYDDTRHATARFQRLPAAEQVKGVELKAVTALGVDPKSYFRAKTTVTTAEDVRAGAMGLFDGGRRFSRDLTGFRDPGDQSSYAEKVPSAAGAAASELFVLAGEATDESGLATVAELVVRPAAEKGMERIVE